MNGSSFPTQTVGADRIRPQHEVPMPPLEGEVVERQRNRRGLFVNRAVQETPQSAYGCQLPFQGRPWQNQSPPPFNAQLNFPTLRAAISRPYRADTLIRVLPEIRGHGRMLSAPTERVLFILLYVLKSNLSY